MAKANHPSSQAVRFAAQPQAAAVHNSQPAPATKYGGNWPVQAPTPSGTGAPFLPGAS